jgi:hypothetical protein
MFEHIILKLRKFTAIWEEGRDEYSFKQDRLCTYIMKMRSVRLTIVAVEKK